MAVRKFDEEFLEKFKIEGFFQKEKKGGQKSVHFVKRNGIKQVLKLVDSGRDDRFEREMAIYDTFKHLNGIPKVYEIAEHDDEIIVFEQFVEGDTLSDIIGNYSQNNAVIQPLISNLFSILKPIWQERYVHRDLKPENIIIQPDSTPVILDFGIARDLSADSITHTGSAQPGSWKWAAPEQYFAQKDLISYRTDFFSLGVISYFLYHQKLPFGDTINQIDAKFKSDDESFTIDARCSLKEFAIETMRFRPAHRPKDIDDVIKLIV